MRAILLHWLQFDRLKRLRLAECDEVPDGVRFRLDDGGGGADQGHDCLGFVPPIEDLRADRDQTPNEFAVDPGVTSVANVAEQLIQAFIVRREIGCNRRLLTRAAQFGVAHGLLRRLRGPDQEGRPLAELSRGNVVLSPLDVIVDDAARSHDGTDRLAFAEFGALKLLVIVPEFRVLPK